MLEPLMIEKSIPINRRVNWLSRTKNTVDQIDEKTSCSGRSRISYHCDGVNVFLRQVRVVIATLSRSGKISDPDHSPWGCAQNRGSCSLVFRALAASRQTVLFMFCCVWPLDEFLSPPV